MERIWEIITEAFPKLLEAGITRTIPLTVLSFALAMVISVAVALIQYANVRVLKQLCRFYIWIIRGTPLLVQLYLVFYGLPKIGLTFAAFPTAVAVFAINEGAYMAESLRGALEAVPKGQMEAGYCVGMTYAQTMRHIVMPQALRTAPASKSPQTRETYAPPTPAGRRRVLRSVRIEPWPARRSRPSSPCAAV